MLEALLRQDYLLGPEKAATADPAHSPNPPLPLAARVCCDVLRECKGVRVIDLFLA